MLDKTLTILIVDDEGAVRESFSDYFEDQITDTNFGRGR